MNKKLILVVFILLLFTVIAACKINDDQIIETSNTSSSIDESYELLFPDAVDVTIPDIDDITYEDYASMSSEEQKAVINNFESMDDFFLWYDNLINNGSSNVVNQATSEALQDETIGNEPTIQQATEPIDISIEGMTYLEYDSLSGADQKEVMNSFDTIDEFITWFNRIKEEHVNSMPTIDDTTPIVLG